MIVCNREWSKFAYGIYSLSLVCGYVEDLHAQELLTEQGGMFYICISAGF